MKLARNQVVQVSSLAALRTAGRRFKDRVKRFDHHSFIFRGQKASWHLETSLERACIETDGNLAQARIRETAIVREFKRRYHHYAVHVPPQDYALQWLSLMQHYGAPTRLLDWTYSIDVAAYFAVESAWKEPKQDAAVWMMNGVWATYRTGDAFTKADRLEGSHYVMTGPKGYEDEATFGPVFMDSCEAVSCVCPVNPFLLNERLTLQKGVFTCVGNVEQSFEENLVSMPGYDNAKYLMKAVIPTASLEGVLKELHNVNIGRATLFPGLDGFSQSLRVNLGSVPSRQEYPLLGT